MGSWWRRSGSHVLSLCPILGETRNFSWATRTLRAVGHTVGRDCFFFAPLPIKEFLTPMTKKNSELLLHPLNQRSISACFFSPPLLPPSGLIIELWKRATSKEEKKKKKGSGTQKKFPPSSAALPFPRTRRRRRRLLRRTKKQKREGGKGSSQSPP